MPPDPDGAGPTDGNGSDPAAADAGAPTGDDHRLPRLLAALTVDLDRSERRRELTRLGPAVAGSARQAGARAVTSGRWLVDLMVRTAPFVPVRDLAELRATYGPLDPEAMSRALVTSAARTSAGVGAAAGALATVEWAAPPTLLTAPIQLAAETLVVVAIEVRMIAELHVVHRVLVPGGPSERAAAYLAIWARGRGVDVHAGTGSFLQSGWTGALGHATRRQIRDRLLSRMARNVTSFGPALTGAVLGAELNRRGTKSLGKTIAEELSRQR